MVKQISAAIVILLLGMGVGYFFANSKASENKIYATYDGGQVTAEEVQARIQNELDQYKQHLYEIKRKAAEEIIRERIKVPAETFIDQVISDDELNAFLKERNIDRKKLKPMDMKSILGNMKLERARQSAQQQTDTALNKLNVKWNLVP